MSQFEAYPFILIPGIARFDYFRSKLIDRINDLIEPDIESDKTHYFKGIRTFLLSQGYAVEYGDIAFADGLETRAAALARSIDEALAGHNQPKVHLVGHSMGGLDARYLVANNIDAARKVATVTTLGSPHLGISLAEVILEKGANDLIKFAKELAIDLTGFQTLTRPAMTQFNEENRQAEATNEVIYSTYTAWQEREDTFAPLRLTWDIINEEEGANDGFVPVVSQAWQAELVADDGQRKKINQREFSVSADHLNQTGRWEWAEWRLLPLNVFKQKRLYEQGVKNAYLKIVQDICSMGP